jgi:hypothetical protein
MAQVPRPRTPGAAIDRDLNLRAAAGCEPIGNDEALIRDYLRRFLAAMETAGEFAPLVAKEVLTPLHARARLLAGGDPARWAAAFSPAEFRELRQQTAIGFAGGKPELLDPAAEVAPEPDVDLDLDGLVTHHQRRLA